MTELILKIPAGGISRCLPIVRSGFLVNARSGMTLEEFLCACAGIPEDYLRERVQTIFLDGSVVDDPATSKIGDRSMVALSAAMPGLVGAAFRKQSAASTLRCGITHRDPAPGSEPGEIPSGACVDGPAVRVVLKLFNLVAQELGPMLLANGVIATRNAVRALFPEGDELPEVVSGVELDGADVPVAELRAGDLPLSEFVLLKVALQ